MGLKGCIREHLGRVFPLAGHVWQLRPASHLLSEPQLSPICYLGLSHNQKKNSNIQNYKNWKVTFKPDEEVKRQIAISKSCVCTLGTRMLLLLRNLCRKWNIIWIFETREEGLKCIVKLKRIIIIKKDVMNI